MRKWLVYEFVEVFDSEEEANNFTANYSAKKHLIAMEIEINSKGEFKDEKLFN